MDKQANSIRVLIAADHPIFRDALWKLLETDPEIAVVGAATDGCEAVELARRLKPDILLLDLAMPGTSVTGPLSELLTSSVRTLLLTAAAEKREIVKALQLGARGVVVKQAPTALLFKSIHAVMAGQYWVGRESTADLVESFRQLASSPGGDGNGSKFGLTARELEIVATVVAAYSNHQIAEQCSISEKTVKHHLTNIFDKLGVFSRLELALFAVHHNLEMPPEPVAKRPAELKSGRKVEVV